MLNKSVICYSRFDGGIWSKPVSISESLGYSYSPAVTVDNVGHVHVVWESVDDGISGIHYRMYDGGKWSDLKRISMDEKSLNASMEACQTASEEARTCPACED